MEKIICPCIYLCFYEVIYIYIYVFMNFSSESNVYVAKDSVKR